jgi:hypothetical protein
MIRGQYSAKIRPKQSDYVNIDRICSRTIPHANGAGGPAARQSAQIAVRDALHEFRHSRTPQQLRRVSLYLLANAPGGHAS